MFKGTRRPIPVRPVMGLVLLLVLSGLLLNVGACDDLDTEASVSSDETTELVSSTTILDETADDGTTMSTTLASVVVGPTGTAVIQASPDLTLQPLSPAISLDPGLLQLWTRHEEDDPNLEFQPGWETVSSSSASGGTYRVTIPAANDPTSVAAYFIGTRIRIIAFKDSVYGEAGVRPGYVGRLSFGRFAYIVYCNDIRFGTFCNIVDRKMKFLYFRQAFRAPAKMRGEGSPESGIFVISRVDPVRQAVIVNVCGCD